MNITHCPSCLKPGFNEFCLLCRKSLFGGKRVSPILPFTRPFYNKRKREQVGRMSISGVQSKHSLKLTGTALELTDKGGEYILKPIPSAEFENLGAMPANEHVTMQIARQIFGISTAECAVVFFGDDFSPAFLTKRFDVLPDGTHLQQEDFAQIAQVSEASHGKNYKYDFSYEKIAAFMKNHVSAYTVEVEKFFKLVLYNYLVNNGDAHLKNFSLYREPSLNGYLLTPAYDLLNTRLHLANESSMALDLFESDFETDSFKANGFYAYDDFFEFGTRIGISSTRVERFIAESAGRAGQIDALLKN
jgi:serine/threonine-protein kinase HipA